MGGEKNKNDSGNKIGTHLMSIFFFFAKPGGKPLNPMDYEEELRNS